MSDPGADALWLQAAGLAAEHLPRTGHQSVRVTRVHTGEYCAVATVTATTGDGCEECACGLGKSWEAALEDLCQRLRARAA